MYYTYLYEYYCVIRTELDLIPSKSYKNSEAQPWHIQKSKPLYENNTNLSLALSRQNRNILSWTLIHVPLVVAADRPINPLPTYLIGPHHFTRPH